MVDLSANRFLSSSLRIPQLVANCKFGDDASLSAFRFSSVISRQEM